MSKYNLTPFSFDTEDDNPNDEAAAGGAEAEGPPVETVSTPRITRFNTAGGTGGGGSIAAADQGKTTLVLVDEATCCGRIGGSGNSRMCIKPGCTTPRHQGDRVEVSSRKLFVRVVGKRDQAYINPSMDEDKIPVGHTLEEVMSAPRSAAVWKVFVTSNQYREEASVGTVGSASLASGEDREESLEGTGVNQEPAGEFVQAARRLQTPSKTYKTLSGTAEDLYFLGAKLGLPASRVLFGETEEGDDSDAEAGEKEEETEAQRLEAIEKSFELISGVAMGQADAMNNLADHVHMGFGKVDEKLLDKDKSMRLLSTQLGSPGNTEDFIGATLWEAVDIVAEKIEVLPTESGIDTRLEQFQCELDFMKEQVEEAFEAKLNVMNVDLQKTFDHISGSMEKLAQKTLGRIKDLEAKANGSGGLYSGGVRGYGAGGRRGYGTNASDPHKANIERLSKRVEHLEKEALNAGNRNSPYSVSSSGSKARVGFGDDEGKMDQLEALFKDLEVKVEGLEKKVAAERAFTSDDESFASALDVLKMIQDEPGSASIGFFPDAFAVADLMVPQAVTGVEHASAINTSQKVGRSAKDSNLLATLNKERPSYPFKAAKDPKSTTLVDRSEGFGINLPSHDSFDVSVNATKTQLKRWAGNYERSLMVELDMTNRLDRCAACLIRKSMAQQNQILDFASRFFRQMTGVNGYKKDPSWCLTGVCVGKIYEEMAVTRSAASGIEDLSSDYSKAQVIWTMMQSHNTLEDIIDKGIETHPALLQEVMNFQLGNRVDVSQLEVLEAEVKAMKALVKEASAAAAKADRAASTLTEKVNRNYQDVGNMKTEVKRLATAVTKK